MAGMRGKYKAYPEYKDSGVEWLDVAPSHWGTVPIKYMALEKSSLFLDGDWIESKDISDQGIRYITTGNVGEGRYKKQGAGFITNAKFEKLGCTEVFPGDVLVSRLNNPIGRACIVPDLSARIVTSVDNVIFRPDGLYLKKFLVYLFSSKDYFRHTSNLARGATMQRISRGLLGNIRVVMPSVKEQHSIANFLDHETAKIDTLIKEQQSLIRLLQEKRQAVISHAVTKGLKPDVPMKDSGVEWLGEVPEHWGVINAKHVSSVFVPQRNKPELNDLGDGVAWVTMEDMKNDRIKSTHLSVNRDAELFAGSKRLQSGSVIASCVGNFGVTAINDIEVIINQQLQAYIPQKLKPEFLRELISISKVYFELVGTAATLVYVNQQGFEELPVTVPPEVEQQELIGFVEKKKSEYNELIELSEQQVELLQERRTALISAAVTGKIDVRAWSAPERTPKQKQQQLAEAIV